jgi:hypothetical protein
MLKRVFGVYINPEVVGWVIHEMKFKDPDHPNRVKRDTVEVFTKEGLKIHSQELTASDHIEAKKNEDYVEAALASLGFKQESDKSQ